MSCEPDDQVCTCDDDLCPTRVIEAATQPDDVIMIRDTDGRVHAAPIELR